MSNFPTSLDDDITLPPVSNNITEIGEELFNALREVAFATEAEIGIGASGTAGSIADRLSVCFNPDGSLKPSAITSLSDGLTTVGGWVTNFHINPSAQIAESKLDLDYSTTTLYNTSVTQQTEIDAALAFIQAAGSKVNPHIAGITYRHVLNHIDISSVGSEFFRDRNNALRDNTNLYTLLGDINTDLISHQKANGTDTGTVPPDNYAHVAAGVFVNTSNFSFVPQTATDLQQFAQFIDNSNIFILGTRIQSFYSNGISRTARSGGLLDTEKGQPIVPETPVTTYLLDGYASAPVDNIDTGDDLVEFFPDAASLANNSFEAKFSAVKIGDILTVNYGSFSVPNIIIEKKSISVDSNKRFLVRINRKNVMDGYGFTAQIDKPLFNVNKYGVLALAQANTPFNAISSLIVANPRGAQILGIDFNPDQLDLAHYNLWLAFYPTGNPATSRVTLYKVDVTGNRGATPGKYTLESVVESTNNSFRAAGFNYRFIAFSYKGNFGIMLADPYGNAGFSIISGIIATSGLYDNGLSRTVYSNNVLGTPGYDSYDALGIGPGKGDLASPAFSATFANSTLAQIPTKLFLPLSRNNYYVNGVERERFALEPGQILDTYGDGYWTATITNKLIVPGVRSEVTYRVDEDLSSARIKAGKTLVIQSSSYVDSGRFFIKDVQFNNCPGDDAFTNIVVYDSIHGIGSSPYLSAPVGTTVGLYFNSDSLGFSSENASDFTTISTPFKRHFEAYINQDGYTFTHERGRLSINSTNIVVNGVDVYTDTALAGLNIFKISPKLRGYAFSSIVKVNLAITAYNQTTGLYSGYMRKWDGSTETHVGPVTTGKKGDVVRFYDETNVDYVDVIFSLDDSISTISSTKHIDIQIFPTLSLDDEVMLLGTCQVNGTTNKIQYLRDERQFGNISETQLSNSALDHIAASTQLINENGIIRGFDISDTDLTGDGYNVFHINGGIAIINGKIVKVNDEFLTIPVVRESLYPAFSVNITTTKWFVCVNESGKFEFVASTDYDPAGSFNASYVAASLDHTRLMYVKNPNDNTGGAEYSIKGTYFSDLITNHKNLVPVAVVTAPIILSSVTYIVDEASVVFEDARRFISNGYSGLAAPFTLGTNASFRTVEALSTWLKELNKYKAGTVNIINKFGDTILVKDSIDISGETFDFGKKIKFVGDGGRFFVDASAYMTNVHLENLRIDTEIGNAITFAGVQNNVTQCYISHSTTASVFVFVMATGASVRFTDNVFTSSVAVTAFINAAGSSKTQILSGNIYKTGTVLIATGTFLPGTITTMNAADGV